MNDYAILVKRSPDYSRYSDQDMQDHLTKVLAWIDTLKSQGRFQDVRRLGPRRGLVSAAGDAEIFDGPFTEAKEILSGFFLIRAESLEEALSLARDCPSVDIGCDLEVREFKALNDS